MSFDDIYYFYTKKQKKVNNNELIKKMELRNSDLCGRVVVRPLRHTFAPLTLNKILFCIGGGAPNRLFNMRFAPIPRFCSSSGSLQNNILYRCRVSKESYYIIPLKSLREIIANKSLIAVNPRFAPNGFRS